MAVARDRGVLVLTRRPSEVVKLGVMKVYVTVLAPSHNVVTTFVSVPATSARVGQIGVDAVSNSADGEPAVGEFLDPEL
jgi:hypothetical protein